VVTLTLAFQVWEVLELVMEVMVVPTSQEQLEFLKKKWTPLTDSPHLDSLSTRLLRPILLVIKMKSLLLISCLRLVVRMKRRCFRLRSMLLLVVNSSSNLVLNNNNKTLQVVSSNHLREVMAETMTRSLMMTQASSERSKT
jgi:hypothetical protein